MFSIYYILANVFSFLKNKEELKPLEEWKDDLSREMKKISKQFYASESTKDKSELKKILSDLDEEYRSISSQLINRTIYCDEEFLTLYEYSSEFKQHICKVNSLEREFKIIKDKKSSMIRQALENITNGGWFQRNDFKIDGVIDETKIIYWFSKTIPKFLNDCDNGDVHLVEFGTTPDKLVPMALYDLTGILTFEWYKKRDEIEGFKQELFSLFEEHVRLETIVRQAKTECESFLVSTYFSDENIDDIIVDVNASKLRDKADVIRKYYDNSSICPSVMHKIALAILIDPCAHEIYELKQSIVPPRIRYGYGW